MAASGRICFYFRDTGFCRNGEQCRFIHDRSAERKGPPPSVPPQVPLQPQASRVCFAFKNGSCRFGDGCKFLHTTPGGPMTPPPPYMAPGPTPASPPEPDEDPMPSPQQLQDLLLHFVAFLEDNYTPISRPKHGAEVRQAVTAFRDAYYAREGPGVVRFQPGRLVQWLGTRSTFLLLSKCRSYLESYDSKLQLLKYRDKFLASAPQYRLRQTGELSGMRAAAVAEAKFFCQACGVNCSSQHLYNQHLNSERHRLVLATQALRHNKDELERDKGGLYVIINPTEVITLNSAPKLITAQVINKGAAEHVLTHFQPVQISADFETARLDQPLRLPPGSGFQINLGMVQGRALGELRVLMVFNFGPLKIGRYLTFTVVGENAADFKALEPVAPYHRDRKRLKDVVEDPKAVVKGEAPPKIQTRLPKALLSYDIPHSLRQEVQSSKMDRIAELLESPLDIANYREKFQTLMHLEEIQSLVDIRHYDIPNAELRPSRDHRLLQLAVPGLAEKRPSVLYGDRVFVTHEGSKFEGYVHQVERESVWLRFNAAFHKRYMAGARVQVQFTFNRTPLRRCHQAIELVSQSPELFSRLLALSVPQSALTVADRQFIASIRSSQLGFYNRLLNEEQKRCVEVVVKRPAFNGLPYVIMGPPGTGKTTTLVEVIKQVLDHHPSARVLACAPSNSAADLLVERLRSKCDRTQMCRVNAYKRSIQEVPQEIHEYCFYNRDLSVFELPSLEALKRYRVVSSTCMTAGLFYSLGLPSTHFDFVFIDEAGHATEPETLVAMAGLVSPSTRVILAGDPQQLGPVIRSQIAMRFLSVSLLERVMQHAAYQRAEIFADYSYYNPLLCTKLLHNYRSHPRILKLPSDMFYHGELIPSADKAMCSSLATWERLPNRDEFPLIFHGVVGKEQREGNSPSWFNPIEALQVLTYCEQLLLFRRGGVSLDQIGVISPYRKQVEKIRTLLRGKGMQAVKVGSVEEFQGQERRVIIISIVRSSSEFIDFDAKYNLGFLSNPRRFNVAITRAQALVIVVGNPFVLKEDRYWGNFLRYVQMNNGYTGCPPPPLAAEDPDSKNDDSDAPLSGDDISLLKSFERLGLHKSADYEYEKDQDGALDFSKREMVEDPGWADHD